MIPGPILFGAIIDSTCILWEYMCDLKGACILFDATRFRLLTHGVSLCFLVCGLLLYIVVYLLVRRRNYDDPVKDEDVNDGDKDSKNVTVEEQGLMKDKESKM